MSLAKNTAEESALNSSQPQSCLCKECVHSNAENPFYEDRNFNLLDLRANYKTKEITVSAKGIQNSGEVPEMSDSHEKEVTVECRERPGVDPACFPDTLSWSDGESQDDCKTPDTEQSVQSIQPLAEDTTLTEVVWKLKHTVKKQQTLIQNLQCCNMYLTRRVAELQVLPMEEQTCADIISELRETAEALIEDKYRALLEKNDAKKTLQSLQDILTNTRKHLQESRLEKETLQAELKRIKGSYACFQERYRTEVQRKEEAVSRCVKMGRALRQKEEEVGRLLQLRADSEEATTSALDLLKREKAAQEQELLSLQEEFQKRESENLEDRQTLKSRLDKLVAQVKNLQFLSESERAKNRKLQEQIHQVKDENAKLQQQAARSEERNCAPKFEKAQLKEHLEEGMESDVTKEAKVIHTNLFLNCSPCEEESMNPPTVKRNPQLASKIHTLLALLVGIFTSQGINNPDAEHFKDSEKVSDTMLQKLKSFCRKRKNLNEELLKHKDRITTFQELIANEKAFQDQVFEVTDSDSNEAKKVRDVPILLGAKLDKHHGLNEKLDFLIVKLGNLLESKEDHCNRLLKENDKYQRHLGNLINKVTSYEEIIQCADQRLEESQFQIAHLEERNKYLQGLMRRTRDRARKARTRIGKPVSCPRGTSGRF